MLGLNLAMRSNNLPPFDPRRLFRNGEQGVWFDPSDLSTLFQDAAGTIPVTGVEQPVGLMLDKSGRGNHASQATTTARPILRAESAAGVQYYLDFDGVDDFLDAGTLDFSAATQAAAVVGIQKLSDAAAARPYSHGLTAGQNGAFRFLAPANSAQASVRAASLGAGGVLQETAGTNDKAAPIKLVLCSTYGASAPVSIRYNGTESRVSSGSLGALTLPSARSVIGAQVAGATTQSSFFLGRIYGLAHIARALSPVEQRILEQFLRNKSRAY